MGEVQYHIGQTLDEVLDGHEEHSFDPSEFGYEGLGFVDTVELQVLQDDDTDTGKLYVLSATCSEYLRFHRELHPELFEPFEDEDDDLELQIKQEAFDALVVVFAENYTGVDVWQSDGGYLRFEVSVTEERGDFPLDALDEGTLWPILAQIANESDPGTFGSEYVWDAIAKMVRDDAE
jgi:hypothetical protein